MESKDEIKGVVEDTPMGPEEAKAAEVGEQPQDDKKAVQAKYKPSAGGLGDIGSMFASKDAKKKRVRDQKRFALQMKETTQPLRKTGDELGALTLELGLLLDCTSSMKTWIDRAKETLNEIIQGVQASCQEEGEVNVRVCFVGYRDIGDNERFALKKFTTDIESAKQFIADVPAEGGADIPEDVQGGLKLMLMQDWTEEATKQVFLIGDAPGHGRKYHDGIKDDYVGGSPDGIKLEDLMSEFKAREIEFNVIKLNPNLNTMVKVMKENYDGLQSKDMFDQETTKVSAPYVPPPAPASYDRGDYYTASASYSAARDEGVGMMACASPSYGAAADIYEMEKRLAELRGDSLEMLSSESKDLGLASASFSMKAKKESSYAGSAFGAIGSAMKSFGNAMSSAKPQGSAPVQTKEMISESYVNYAVESAAMNVKKNCKSKGIRGGRKMK